MNRRTIIYMTGIVILSVALLLGLNLFSLYKEEEPAQPYVRYNDVRGVEVVHRGVPYTLNFDQQNKVLAFLNGAEKSDEKVQGKGEGIDFDEIIIYLFSGSTVVVKPVSINDHNLVYRVAKWSSDGVFQERSGGAFLALISQTYDLEPASKEPAQP